MPRDEVTVDLRIHAGFAEWQVTDIVHLGRSESASTWAEKADAEMVDHNPR
jgi:hypothetical protein